MMSKETGLYLHIPFCVRKCAYCDFLSAPAKPDMIHRYMLTLGEEIRRTGQSLAEEEGEPVSVSTIFFGGGTPSIVKATDIQAIMNAIQDSFHLLKGAEITLEANPGTVTRESLTSYLQSGINRLSFGLQSFQNVELCMLNRIHSAEEFVESYQMAREMGFRNINVDLMSALPGQSLQTWKDTLRRTLELEPEHLSAYSLIIEEGTPFFTRYGTPEGRKLLPDENTDRQMYQQTKYILEEKGFHRYEISNYARPYRECRHNIRYWTGKNYLGFGIGAASYWEGIRYSNTRSLDEYLNAGGAPDIIKQNIEVLSTREKMEEFMFLGLRMMKGISLSEFYARFGVNFEQIYGAVSRKLYEEGLLYLLGDRVWLSEYGVDVSNQVFEEFLLTQELTL